MLKYNRCKLCRNRLELFHKGIRDSADIDVLKCNKCGLIQLSEFVTSDEHYQSGGNHINQYHASTDQIEDETWDIWVKETEFDDDRRFDQLKEMVAGKRVLDFGCGNGGFLRRIGDLSREAVGVELDYDARKHLVSEGITVKEHIYDYDGTFEVITMFHVVEHLTEPDSVLQSIRKHLCDDGILVVETPNSCEALISRYRNKAFMDYTFWTDHVMLYNSDNLSLLMRKNGFELIESSQIQRYSLSNHLYWLSQGKPGGHVKWTWINDSELDRRYEAVLRKNNNCDTLFHMYKKCTD